MSETQIPTIQASGDRSAYLGDTPTTGDRSTQSDIEALLFDLDGTIIDTHDAILRSMKYAIKTVLGAEYPEERLMRKVGQPLRIQMADFSRSEAENDELLRVYRAYQAEIHDSVVKSFEGTAEVLALLKDAGYLLGIVTSKMHQPALQGLQLFGLDEYFSCLVGADDCHKHKPDPAPVEYGAKLIGIAPQKCFYVGDSPYDIQAGNAAGAITVAALWGMFSSEHLMEQSPSYVCESITDLPLLLSL